MSVISVEGVVSEERVPTILTVDKVAAPTKVIEPSPTVRIISESLVAEEYSLPEMLSVEFSLKPLIVSLPSPKLYKNKTDEPLF